MSKLLKKNSLRMEIITPPQMPPFCADRSIRVKNRKTQKARPLSTTTPL